MQANLVGSQISNFKTYEMYKRQCLALAENVFEFPNMPEFIDTSYLNGVLLRQGSIAFFIDEAIGLLALPYSSMGTLDVYNRPRKIQVYGVNGYTKVLDNENDFVIMYDNNGRYPLWLDIVQYAERLALDSRTSDINIAQQKTPRFWKTKTEKAKSVRDLVNNVDGMCETVITYDNIDLDDTTLVLQPAPYVADKIQEHKDKLWNEFLRLIGVANLTVQKKERNISDEIKASQGGTIATRFNRFEPRKKAVDEINKKFSNITLLDGRKALEKPIEVKYYDGLPTTLDDDIKEENKEESEVKEDDV